jgi:hypothetical protein
MSDTTNPRGPKKSVRLRVAADLIAAYINLSEDGREYLESNLAGHVYGDTGMDHYTPGTALHKLASGHQQSMCECISPSVGKPWAKWANMIKRSNLWEFERREAVREMLGVLISNKNKARLDDDEVLAAAEKALEWIRWHEHNLELSRLRNSSEYKACLDALASGDNREEATRQFAALASAARTRK